MNQRQNQSVEILRVNSRQLQFLRGEVRKLHPVEACAILFGRMIGREAIVKRVVGVQNVLKSTTGFEIDPKAFFDAFMQADEDGLGFIGLFHSHPAPASPSGVDLKFMRLWGDVVWLILSSTHDKFAAFQMIDGKVRAVALKTDKL